MVVRGKIRGNGSQLAKYLLTKGDNDNVQVLEIVGTAQERDLRKSLLEMSLTSELTKTDKGLYHVQICPAYGEDRKMTDEDWKRAAEIIEQEAGYSGQKRVIVLHEKKGKIHAHVVWERFNHEKGVMIPNKFSRLAQDRARVTIEQVFEHARTPERNKQRPEMKQYLSDMWRETENASSFMKQIAERGYVIAAGTQRPFMVIDNDGRSFNLVRQLDKVKTSEVRDRFKTTKLVKEKEAIEQVRAKQKAHKSKAQSTSNSRREIIKVHANDNKAEITAPKKNYKMQASFEISGKATQQAEVQLAAVLKTADEKQTKKQALQDKLKQQRLQLAKAFRENERDL